MINIQTHNPVRKEFLGIGEVAIDNTARIMRDIIIKSTQNQYVRKWAEKMLDRVPDHNEYQEVSAVYQYLANNIRYTKDPHGFEYIKTPPVSLQQMDIGELPNLDCDDMTVLSLSLLKSIGYPVALRLASFNRDKKFRHVYGLVFVKQYGWVPFDLVKKKGLGWEAPHITNIKDIKI